MDDKIRVLLVDDHKIIRDGLKFYFEDTENIIISEEASDGVEALKILENATVDLVITDISMPNMDGLELLIKIREKWPNLKVLAITMLGEVTYIKKMIAAGVDGYLLKNSSEQEILTAVKEIKAGGTYYSREVTHTLIDDLTRKGKTKSKLSVEVTLSAREKEVLELIIMELSNQEIAEKLFISQRTVEAHKRNLLDKTGAKNIAGLVLFAVEHKLVEH